MIIEQAVINILLTEEGYNKYRDVIPLDSLEANLKKILICIDKLYNKGVKEIKLEDLKVFLISQYPSMKEDVKKLIFGLLDSIYAINSSDIVYKEIIQNYRNKQIAAQCIIVGTDGIDNPGRFDIDRLKKICDDYDKTEDEETVKFDEFTTAELMEVESDESGLSWPWKKWDECVGKLRGGRVTLLFAYPNMGKSALCHTISTHFAQYTKVLVINNEEKTEKAIRRARSCWCEMTRSELTKDPKEADRRWEVIKDNWKFKQDVALTPKNLKKYIRASGAKLVIIDQAVKIVVKKTERRDADLGEIFKQLRIEVQDEFSDVDIIGIGRGDINSKTAKKVTMDMLADCKSEVQGEVDNMIAMQRPNEGDFMNIFFCKVKDTGKEGEEDVLQLIREHSRVIDPE